MIAIDKLCYYSNLRYVNAGEKFAYAVLTLLFCVASRSIPMAVLVLIVNGILTVYKGGIPFSRYMHFMVMPFVFLLLSTLAILINISKTPLDAFSIAVGKWYITSSWQALYQGFQLILTALASVSCLYFLSFNTPITDILTVLKKLRCPALIIELMLLIYRFIFVLLDISSAISISQDARLGNKDLKTAYQSFGKLISILFIRAMKKSNSLYDAMESRCYDGYIHVLSEDFPPKKKNIMLIILFESVLLMITIGGYLM